MELDIDKIPFSTYGSYFVISKDGASSDIYLRDLHGGDEAPSNLYNIKVVDHAAEEWVVSRTETELVIESNKVSNGRIQIVFGEYDTVHVLTTNLAVNFVAVGGKYDTLVPLSSNQFEHHLYEKQIKVMFTKVQGEMRQEQEWKVIGSKDANVAVGFNSYVVIESYKTIWKKKTYNNFEQIKKDREDAYALWETSFKNKSGTFESSRKLASYISWANFVHKEGLLTSDAMYMSKNWMFNIWSWDNCFGGVALSKKHPALAYGQMKIFIDNQDASGCYPDYVNETFASFNCVKPPIHAWAYSKMMKENNYFEKKELLLEMYGSLCKVTNYWIDSRKNENAIFPVYYHGNDSGWDNASTFQRGFPVESPDLAAFLIYQIDKISEIAEKLGKRKEGKKWKEKANNFFEKFMERFYVKGQFHGIYTPTKEVIFEGDSLLMYMPIIIGYRMEQPILAQLVNDLETRFETPYGLSTECKESPYYKEGGYWLGPIWAPTTYLLIDSLRNNGYEDFALRLANKFCEVTKIGLMAENYDPFTGKGYDDPAFSWPSCVLLQLLTEYDDLKES